MYLYFVTMNKPYTKYNFIDVIEYDNSYGIVIVLMPSYSLHWQSFFSEARVIMFMHA